MARKSIQDLKQKFNIIFHYKGFQRCILQCSITKSKLCYCYINTPLIRSFDKEIISTVKHLIHIYGASPQKYGLKHLRYLEQRPQKYIFIYFFSVAELPQSVYVTSEQCWCMPVEATWVLRLSSSCWIMEQISTRLTKRSELLINISWEELSRPISYNFLQFSILHLFYPIMFWGVCYTP